MDAHRGAGRLGTVRGDGEGDYVPLYFHPSLFSSLPVYPFTGWDPAGFSPYPLSPSARIVALAASGRCGRAVPEFFLNSYRFQVGRGRERIPSPPSSPISYVSLLVCFEVRPCVCVRGGGARLLPRPPPF